MIASEHGLLLRGPMVRALLAGRKTQTRRLIKPQPAQCYWIDGTPTMAWKSVIYNPHKGDPIAEILPACPYGGAGDRLWLRETFVLEQTDDLPADGRPYCRLDEPGEFGRYVVPHYRATEPEPHIVPCDLADSYDDRTRWSPSIHMPRWVARVVIGLVGVRIERVQDITNEDAKAEGVSGMTWINHPEEPPDYRVMFWAAWDKIYAAPGLGWEANPWAWVLEWPPYEEATHGKQ